MVKTTYAPVLLDILVLTVPAANACMEKRGVMPQVATNTLTTTLNALDKENVTGKRVNASAMMASLEMGAATVPAQTTVLGTASANSFPKLQAATLQLLGARTLSTVNLSTLIAHWTCRTTGTHNLLAVAAVIHTIAATIVLSACALKETTH